MAPGQSPHEEVCAGGRRSLCSSDADESWHSTYGSNRGSGSFDGSDPEIGAVLEACRKSSESDSGLDSDLGSGLPEIKVHLAKVEKDCRICHLSLEGVNQESGIPIELGCSCKNDLAAAHKQCAEAWFRIRGNKTCEICGATARNVVIATEPEVIEHPNESNNVVSVPHEETRSFWHGHRFLNFLLACMVFAFVISWLFHFNVKS